MNFKAKMTGRKAYAQHIAGNRMEDARRFSEAQQHFDTALALYAQAREDGCDDVRYMMAYGVLLLKQSRFDKAREIMRATEQIPGRSADEKKQLRLNYAVCQWKLGNLDQAIALMQQVAQDGKNSMIYGSLGYMLIEKARETGDFAEAVAFNDEAYDYDEDDPVTLDNLGQLALAQGDRAKARAWFKRAIQQKPTQVDTRYYLAKLAHEDGDDAAAREHIEAALEGHYSALCTTTREAAAALRDSLAQ
ncbi:MAG: tetratricopeptide repeat protein [Clostridia bacterium]